MLRRDLRQDAADVRVGRHLIDHEVRFDLKDPIFDGEVRASLELVDLAANSAARFRFRIFEEVAVDREEPFAFVVDRCLASSCPDRLPYRLEVASGVGVAHAEGRRPAPFLRPF